MTAGRISDSTPCHKYEGRETAGVGSVATATGVHLDTGIASANWGQINNMIDTL
jgi:hypothetical protein